MFEPATDSVFVELHTSHRDTAYRSSSYIKSPPAASAISIKSDYLEWDEDGALLKLALRRGPETAPLHEKS